MLLELNIQLTLKLTATAKLGITLVTLADVPIQLFIFRVVIPAIIETILLNEIFFVLISLAIL